MIDLLSHECLSNCGVRHTLQLQNWEDMRFILWRTEAYITLSPQKLLTTDAIPPEDVPFADEGRKPTKNKCLLTGHVNNWETFFTAGHWHTHCPGSILQLLMPPVYKHHPHFLILSTTVQQKVAYKTSTSSLSLCVPITTTITISPKTVSVVPVWVRCR